MRSTRNETRMCLYASAVALVMAGTQGVARGQSGELGRLLKDYPDGDPVKALAKELQSLDKPSPLAQPAPGDDELKKLRKERYQSARVQCVKFFDMFVAGSLARGRDPFGLLLKSLNLLAESELALSDSPTDQIAALQRRVTLIKGIESINKTRFELGKTALSDYEGARYELLDAEVKLAELKRKLAGAKK
jgi:hypothetical protein